MTVYGNLDGEQGSIMGRLLATGASLASQAEEPEPRQNWFALTLAAIMVVVGIVLLRMGGARPNQG